MTDEERRLISLDIRQGDQSGGEFCHYKFATYPGDVVPLRNQSIEAPDLAVHWDCKSGRLGSHRVETRCDPKLTRITRQSTIPLADREPATNGVARTRLSLEHRRGHLWPWRGWHR